MPVTAVVGAQWGDEGKGKIVDLLAQNVDLIIRANGGNNAGHTIDNEYTQNMPEGVAKLHIMPAGIFNPDAVCIIGTGTVINLSVLVEELTALERAGVSTERLLISKKAHLIMPWHIVLDEAEEVLRNRARDVEQIGTTKRGIGPVYSRKYSRGNLRVEDLLLDRKELYRKFYKEWKFYRELLNKVLKHEPELLGDGNYFYVLERDTERIAAYIRDTEAITWRALDENKNILIEGAQGVLLDIDHGTYPYVTSSCCTIAALAQGSGIPPSKITERIGVVKAYTTRVGAGAFPTRLKGALEAQLREWGNEYGATTGRGRMCGWIDLPLLKYSQRLNDFTSLAITKLDILSNLPQFYAGIGYRNCRSHGEIVCTDPSCGLLETKSANRLINSWDADISGIRSYMRLPINSRDYVATIEREMECTAKYISVGPRRDQTIVR